MEEAVVRRNTSGPTKTPMPVQSGRLDYAVHRVTASKMSMSQFWKSLNVLIYMAKGTLKMGLKILRKNILEYVGGSLPL